MNKQVFHQHLVQATGHALAFARRFVRNRLPESFQYVVHLNQSNDPPPLKEGEHVFPDDVVLHGACTGPLAVEQVVDLLWRDGRIPEWIDISVARTDGTHSFIQLLCCGRFTDREELLYYALGDVCPFGIKSPVLPRDWKDGDPPFDLHWHQGLHVRGASPASETSDSAAMDKAVNFEQASSSLAQNAGEPLLVLHNKVTGGDRFLMGFLAFLALTQGWHAVNLYPGLDVLMPGTLSIFCAWMLWYGWRRSMSWKSVTLAPHSASVQHRNGLTSGFILPDHIKQVNIDNGVCSIVLKNERCKVTLDESRFTEERALQTWLGIHFPNQPAQVYNFDGGPFRFLRRRQ